MTERKTHPSGEVPNGAASGSRKGRQIDYNNVLFIFIQTDEKTRHEECKFHGFKYRDIKLYMLYLVSIRPCRLSQAFSHVLDSKGFYFPKQSLSIPEMKSLKQAITTNGLDRQLSIHFGIARNTCITFISAHLPYRFPAMAYEILKAAGIFTDYKMHDKSITYVDPEQREQLEMFVSLGQIPTTTNFRTLLRNSICMDVSLPVTDSMLNCLVNLRTCSPPSKHRLPQASELHWSTPISANMIAAVRNGKYISYSIEEYQRLLYNLAAADIRTDLTNEEIADIINVYSGRFFFNGMNSVRSLLLLLRGFHMPELKEYQTLLDASNAERVYRVPVTLTGLYRTPDLHNILPIQHEAWIVQFLNTHTIEELFVHIGGVLPLPTLPVLTYILSTIHQVFTQFLRSMRRRIGSIDMDDYTDAELMKISNIKSVLFSNTYPLRAVLLFLVNSPACFIPIECKSRNATDFTNGDPIGKYPYLAYGTVNNYVAYTLTELQQVCEPMNVEGKLIVKPLRPDDVKSEFSVKELRNIAGFVDMLMNDVKTSQVINHAADMVQERLSRLGIDELSKPQRAYLLDILLYIIDTAFYMRKWKAPIIQTDAKTGLDFYQTNSSLIEFVQGRVSSSSPGSSSLSFGEQVSNDAQLTSSTNFYFKRWARYTLPLKAKDTRAKGKENETKVYDYLKVLDKKSNGIYDNILDKIPVPAAVVGDPLTIGTLLRQISMGVYCIRIGSGYLIRGCENCLRTQFNIKLPFDVRELESIS